MATVEHRVGAEKNPAEVQKWSEVLRQDKRIFILDDHSSSIRLAQRILAPNFPGVDQIESETDPVQAVETIAQKAAAGKIDVLVLDMDMPQMTGKEVIIALAKRNVFVPTVVFSGGQGNEISCSLLASISCVKNRGEVAAMVDQMVAENHGMAITYVRKESVVIDPELLCNAVDAMLIAGERRVNNLNLLFNVDQVNQPTPVLGRVEAIYARIADECLTFIYDHNIFTAKAMAVYTERLTEIHDPELRAEMAEIIDDLLILDPYEYSYGELIQIRDSRSWDMKRHRLMGNSGLTGYYSQMEELTSQFGNTDFSIDEYEMQIFLRFRKAFTQAEHQLWLAFRNETSAADTVELALVLTGEETGCQVSKIEDFVFADPDDLIPGIIEEAITNARCAVRGKEHSNVQISLGKKESNGAKVGYICVQDNGDGIPPQIIEAWEKDGEITSTKTGQNAKGLKLMKANAAKAGAVMSIDTGPDGTKIYFLFPLKDSE